MAFRLEDSVVRGEIDNRVKAIVRGKIWLEGRAEPIVLELQGNAGPDLAGCLLTFVNPQKRIAHGHLDSLHPLQRGSIGDLTASRRVRVFGVPMAEAFEMMDRNEKPPEHMANSLYLEWFSDTNGRVVIESTDFQLTISAPEWRMTPEENGERTKQASAGMEDFMGKLTEAVEQQKRGQKDPKQKWDEHDYEKFLKECDARTDKHMELLDKYGDSNEAEEKIAQEMGWDEPEEDNEDDSEDERMSVDEINAICEAAVDDPLPEPEAHREGIDWIRTADGYIRHPLQYRCSESAIKFRRQARDLVGECSDRDLDDFVFEFQRTAAKLAGALNSFARGAACPEAAFTVANLKRALDRLHKCQAGLEAVASKKLLPETLIAAARQELFELRESILRLMDEFRGRG